MWLWAPPEGESRLDVQKKGAKLDVLPMWIMNIEHV